MRKVRQLHVDEVLPLQWLPLSHAARYKMQTSFINLLSEHTHTERYLNMKSVETSQDVL